MLGSNSRSAGGAPLIGALVLAVCCGAPLILAAIATTGIGAALAALGWPLLGIVIMLAGVSGTAWRWRRRSDAARNISTEETHRG